MSDIQLLIKDNNPIPLVNSRPIAVLGNAEVRDLLPELVTLFRLPPRNSYQQEYHYSLRRSRSNRLLPEARPLSVCGVYKGDTLVIEPTVPLREIFRGLPPLVQNTGSNVSVMEPRLRRLLDLMGLVKRAAAVVEEDIKQGVTYEWLNLNNILVSGTPPDVTVFIGHCEPHDYRISFQNNSLQAVRNFSREQVVRHTRRVASLSPQQRLTGFTEDASQFLSNNVYSLGASLYEGLTGNNPPLVELNTNMDIMTGQMRQSYPELGEPLCRIITRAMHPNPSFRFQFPGELTQAFAAELAYWVNNREKALKAVAFSWQPQGYDEARATMNQIKPEYITAWNLTPHLDRLQKTVSTRDLYREAEKKHDEGKFREELVILDRLYKIEPSANLQGRIAQLLNLMNYEEAIELQRSRKREDWIKAMQMLRALPPGYADVPLQIQRLQEKISRG
jgi:hypothetical protein